MNEMLAYICPSHSILKSTDRKLRILLKLLTFQLT